MRVFVTGGSSDVGYFLAQKLVADGHGVVAFDITDRSDPVDGVEFVEGDIRDFAAVRHAAGDCDTGIHLAVCAGESSAEDIMSVNVSGAYAFLMAARTANFRSSIVASSAPVHLAPDAPDDNMLLRTSGDDDHVYDLTKALQEFIARDFHSHGLPVLCLRFGHIVWGKEETNLDSPIPLREFDYCRGGWVALEDVVTACASALQIAPDVDSFEVLNLVGSRTARDRFDVSKTEKRLQMNFEYDFSNYE